VLELGLESLLNELADFRSESEAAHCRKTLQLLIDDCIETVSNKIVDLIGIMADKVST
jgi:BAI1-associated protein 3